MRFDFAATTWIGARDYQEDKCAFAPLGDDDGAQGMLCVLCDGMGGHVGGAVASGLACETFLKSFSPKQGKNSAALYEALVKANVVLAEKVADEPDLDGMGATLIGALITQAGLRWVSVGDSQLYIYRDGVLHKLNEDHSMAPKIAEMLEDGSITQDEADNHPHRNALRSVLTGGVVELVDLPAGTVPVGDNDWVILASDGLDTLEPAQIEGIVAETLDDDTGKGSEADAPSAAEAVAKALMAAVEAKTQAEDLYQDNTTIMVVGLKPAPVEQADDGGPGEGGQDDENRDDDTRTELPATVVFARNKDE